jgi:hypothetical protein
MKISKMLLDYFNGKKSKSTQKNHTRFRNDICNHWDMDYLSMEELEKLVKDDEVKTTIPKKKEDY